jgi:alkylation response protein AidB-like acyl-CoA dehydrogenase
LSEDGKHIPQVKKCGFRMQDSVAYSLFLLVLEMIKILLVLLKIPMTTEFQWEEEEHKLEFVLLLPRQVFFNETKVPVENMLSERGNGFKIAMNALNVGRIKLAAACLDAQRRVITNATVYANEVQLYCNHEFERFCSKLAEMATLVMLGKCTYRAAKY